MTTTNMSDQPPLRVLVIEDETDLRDAMLDYLQLEGCLTTGASRIADCAAWLAHPASGVIVLDLGLPEGDGLTALGSRLDRRRHALVLATARGRLEDRIRGYDEGGDVYLVKPVDMRELSSVVRGLASRLSPPPPAAPDRPGVWTLHTLNWRLTAPDGTSCSLSQYERRLLVLLGRRPGGIMTRMAVQKALSKDGLPYDSRSLEALVRRLRNKCIQELGVPLPLQTVHGAGYALVTEFKVIDSV
jgi:two-component system, OmpR family, response regulator